MKSYFFKQSNFYTKFKACVYYISILISALSCSYSMAANVNDKASSIIPLEINPAEGLIYFNKALNYDFSGDHVSARKIYDKLKNSQVSEEISVPSAVNLVALNRYDEAEREFIKLLSSKDESVRSYAKVWILWISARMSNHSHEAFSKRFKKIVKVNDFSNEYQLEIFNTYIKNEGFDNVFKEIKEMENTNEIERRNAYTEAAFFIGGYYRYLKDDPSMALKIYKDQLDKLYERSLEWHLIKKEIAELELINN